MKKRFVAFALLGTLTQCINEVAPSRIEEHLGQPFTLQPGQAVQLGGQTDGAPVPTDNPLTVRVIEAFDGRCPSWAKCVTAGSAFATALVSRGEVVSDTLSLCLGDCDFTVPYRDTDQVSFRLGPESYVLHLKSIDSREQQGQATLVERVTLLLEKK